MAAAALSIRNGSSGAHNAFQETAATITGAFNFLQTLLAVFQNLLLLLQFDHVKS
jgi:hypothetical protein